jgi:hypothetical protein
MPVVVTVTAPIQSLNYVPGMTAAAETSPFKFKNTQFPNTFFSVLYSIV